MKRRILLLLIIIKAVTCEQAFPSPCIGSGEQECQAKAHGKYPDCDDCRKFVTCLFDHRVDRICTIPGTVYDRITGDCRHDIACGGDSLGLVPVTSTTASTTTTLTTIPTSTTTTTRTTSTSSSANFPSKTTSSTTSTITSTNIPSTSSTSPSTSPSTTSTTSTASTTTTTPPPTTTTTSDTTTAFMSTITNLAALVLRVFDPILPTVTTLSTTSTAITTPSTTTLSSQGVPAVNSGLNALPSGLLVQGPSTSITTTTTTTSLPLNHSVLQAKTTSATPITTTTTTTSLPLNHGVLQAKTTSATPMTTTTTSTTPPLNHGVLQAKTTPATPITTITTSTTPPLNHDVVKATTTSATTTTPQQTFFLLSAQDDLFGQSASGQSATEASASSIGSDPLSIGDIPTTTSSPEVAPRGQITTSKYVHKDNGIRLVQQNGPRVFSSPCLALLDSCLHRSDGQYPSCNTCSTRVICRSEVKLERWCPSGTLYDRYVGRCRSWELVKCFGF